MYVSCVYAFFSPTAAGIIQWDVRYDAFDVLVGELELLLAQVAAGAG